MSGIQFADNFAWSEFVRSQTAMAKGIDNTPPLSAVVNATRLAVLIAQPLRDAIQPQGMERRIKVLSWYRSPELNAALPGSSNRSDHMTGRAIDIRAQGMTVPELFEAVRYSNLPFRQAIIEFPNSPTGGWLHLSIDPVGTAPRREVLFASGDRANPTYTRVSV